MSANIKASTNGTQAIIGVGGVDQMTVSNAGVVTANSFVGLNSSSVMPTGSTTARTLANRFADVANVKDFGAVGNGIADDRIAFQNAIATGKSVYIPDGTYNLTTGVVINDYNAKLILIGSSKDKVKLISNIGTWMFLGNIKGVQFENITFDGRRVRDINGWPYSNPQTNNGSFRAIQATSLEGQEDSFVIIDKCDFLNFSSLPIFFYFFQNAKVTNSKFYKTLDPGFVFCNNVIWSNNICEYIADNGVSMSRGNQNVIIESSIFKDCQGSGVWVSGFVIPGTGTVTATGASYNVLDQVTLTSTSPWQAIFDGAYITQYSGSLEATYKIISVTSPSTAIGVCINSINVAFQGVPISNWEYSPSSGPSNFKVSNNIIIGARESGVFGMTGNSIGSISSNTIIRSGFCVNSEISTIGSIASGSNVLNVDNSSYFNIGDYLIIEPINSNRTYFISTITNKSGNTLTLSTNAPITYVQEFVRKIEAHGSGEVRGFHMNLSGDINGFPDTLLNNISITDNIMHESNAYAIYLTNDGPSKNISIKGNSIFVPQNGVGSIPAINKSAVEIAEYSGTVSENINITDNVYTGAGRICRFAQNGITPRPFIVCNNNTYPNGLDFRAFDFNTSTDVTDSYRTSHYNYYGAMTADAITVKSLQFVEPWTVATVVSGVMDVKLSTLQFAGTNPTTQITDFTKGVNSDLVLFSLRNSSLTVGNTITIVQDYAKIRTQSNANLILDAGETALFCFLNSTVVAQIG
jgi:hypothetical protein